MSNEFLRIQTILPVVLSGGPRNGGRDAIAGWKGATVTSRGAWPGSAITSSGNCWDLVWVRLAGSSLQQSEQHASCMEGAWSPERKRSDCIVPVLASPSASCAVIQLSSQKQMLLTNAASKKQIAISRDITSFNWVTATLMPSYISWRCLQSPLCSCFTRRSKAIDNHYHFLLAHRKSFFALANRWVSLSLRVRKLVLDAAFVERLTA